ncbi:MAG: peptidoglycan DD-metalloendopeptidase family protein [Anaerolineae bacterium]|nr:peptidoglycan DD-metalloendopeptidase family protein [Thermoflexales bacterium]MDW8406494.1 peptidoglycan DD-metalloendopeptidase family protein [Anaerolineae bacterium]
MRYDNRFGRLSRYRSGAGRRSLRAGISRYIAHFIILVIAVIAVILATAQLPLAATPVSSSAATPPSNLGQPGLVLARREGALGGGDEGSVIRNLAPLTETGASSETASSANSSRGLIYYSVQPGDTLFGIAAAFGLTPETVLWSNYKALKDNPDLLSIGMELVIPPSNGLVVEVEAGDTIEAIARRFQVSPESIVEQKVNNLSNVNQVLQVGQELFVPGGQRETVIWQVPKPVQVSRNPVTGVAVYRVGRCGEVAIPTLGTGSFIYPTNRRYLSGYNFSSWHPGLDFAGRLGEPIYAVDSGTVIYAGYSLNAAGVPVGYGQYVVLDHGNGYQTLYAHASQLYVTCGQQVLQGTVIAAVGSVGRSTGPHLHFEIRAGGRAINPWSVLPAP